MSIFSEERFLLELTLGTFPYILLLNLCLSRALQIQPLPSQNPYELPVSLRIKMFLTLVLAGLLATMTAFTLIFEDYWIDFWFSLIFLAQGFVLIIQIFVMGYEYKKMSPSPWYFNLLFWALSSFMYFIFLSNSLLFLVTFLCFY